MNKEAVSYRIEMNPLPDAGLKKWVVMRYSAIVMESCDSLAEAGEAVGHYSAAVDTLNGRLDQPWASR